MNLAQLPNSTLVPVPRIPGDLCPHTPLLESGLRHPIPYRKSGLGGVKGTLQQTYSLCSVYGVEGSSEMI
jgi:hypothetical protein